MSRKFIFGTIIFVLGLTHSFLYGFDNLKLSGAFLYNPVNARANGMGSAFTAVAHDPSAGWWNPAGLGFVKKFQMSGMYAVMSIDRVHNFVGISLPSENGGTLGIHWQQFGVKNIDGRDIKGQHTKYFNDDEMAFGISYSIRFGSYLSIGATGKYLFQTLEDYKATGYSSDAAAMINVKEVFHLGFIVQNVFNVLKWDTDLKLQEKLRKQCRAGIGLQPKAFPILLTFDAAKFDLKKSGKIRYYGGCEYQILPDIFAIRGGFADRQLTAGASIGWQGKDFGVRLDYAYVPDVLEQGATNQFSVGIEF